MIDNFWDEYRWLSNFYMVPVFYEGVWYPSSEHAYQAAKTVILSERLMIRDCKTAGKAKRMGSKKKKKITLRPGWDSMRFEVMLAITISKYKNDELAMKLIATDPEKLVEGNTWHDNFWGECRCEDCKLLIKLNNLGLVLTIVRAMLIKERGFGNESIIRH